MVDRQLVTKIGLFDVYEGAGLPEGKKSLAVSVTLQPRERTLTDAEIEAFSQRLVAAVEKSDRRDAARLNPHSRGLLRCGFSPHPNPPPQGGYHFD